MARHIAIDKATVLRMLDNVQIRVGDVLDGFTGTRQEAINAVRADPRVVFSPCDHYDARGYCLGHTAQTARKE